MNDLFDSKIVLSISEIEDVVSDKEKLAKLIYYDKNIELFNSNYTRDDYIANIDSYIYAHMRLPIDSRQRNKIIQLIFNFIDLVLTPLIKEDILYFYKLDFVLLLLKNNSLIDYELKKQIASYNLFNSLTRLYYQNLEEQKNAIINYSLKRRNDKQVALFYIKEYYQITKNDNFVYEIYENANKTLKKLMSDDNILKSLLELYKM